MATRGLDIPHVAHVINFYFPNDIDDYVHCIGHTGHAGKSGLVTSFFNESNLSLARSLTELMQEANQEVPSWLSNYATRFAYGGGGRNRRYGGGIFDARDYRRDVNRAGGDCPGGAYGSTVNSYGALVEYCGGGYGRETSPWD